MKYPQMRNELVKYVRGLSDCQYQRDCWVSGNCPEGVEYDELDYAIHFLFDDTELSSNPRRTIGFFLRNDDEADSIRYLCEKIDLIFQKYGTTMSDQEYIDCPEWVGVLDAAKKAYGILCSS